MHDTTTSASTRQRRYDIIQVPRGHHVRDRLRQLAALLTINERESGSVMMWEAVCLAIQRETERQQRAGRVTPSGA